MKKLREITTRYSLAELVEALASQVVDGETEPVAKPKDEKEFVKFHKTEKHAEPYGNKKASDAVKTIDRPATRQGHKAGSDNADTAFNLRNAKSDEQLEEVEIDEAAGIARGMAKSANPLIKRPKFDAHGNVVLTKDAKRNIAYGKAPRSRKLTGTPYTGKKAFGEDKEQLDEGKTDKYRKRSDRANKYAKIDSPKDKPLTGQDAFKYARNVKTGKPVKKEPTVLVSPKGEKGAGKVSRIPKSQYDPKKHSLAEEQLDELKKETLSRYTKVAAASAVGAAARKDFSKAVKRVTGINKAQDRLTGTYEVGKPVKVMVPGKNDNDPASGPYTMKRKKLYHGEETQLDEVITKKTPVGDVIHDFVHSSNKKFSGDSKKQRIKRALGAYYGMKREALEEGKKPEAQKTPLTKDKTSGKMRPMTQAELATKKKKFQTGNTIVRN